METTLTLLAAFSLSVAATDPSTNAKALMKNMDKDDKAIERPAPVRKGRRASPEVMAEAEVPAKRTI